VSLIHIYYISFNFAAKLETIKPNIEMI